MAIIQSLRKIGEDARFFNIDYFRYSHEQVEAHFKTHQFDVVGISAVVSTAYAYTKYLSMLIRAVSPDTKIIVGGNLAASAEILLRKCEVDFCVIGDGEFIVQDLIRVLYGRPLNYDRLRETKGIAFLDEQGKFCFTGYGAKPSAEEIESPDYGLLEADGSLPHFISDQVADRVFGLKGEAEPGKTVATVTMAKGCVARCTFCHRFEKGFRVRPVEKTIEHLRYLMAQYNVGYVMAADENFGADRKVAREVASRLGDLGLKWMVAGVRVRTVNKESLQHWKDNGCVAVIYGIESGSPKMLKIMEKNATLEENINALKWTYEAGLDTIIQLVLGMPGENDETIHETIEFLKEVAPYIREWEGKMPSESISINYAQALPGTPLYEYARQHGLIGKEIDDEEQYLIRISDTDAYKTDHFVNLTALPLLKVLTWRFQILSHLDAHHYRTQYGGDHEFSLLQLASYYSKVAGYMLLRRFVKKGKEPLWGGERQQANAFVRDSGYFNIHAGVKFAPLLLNPITRKIFYPLLALVMLLRHLNKPILVMHLVFEHLRWTLKRGSPAMNMPEKSLRKIITIVPSGSDQSAAEKMLPLRMGR
jgi:anaerobic magnesium-protoporphyrin IX monomethyl ester cyclase